MSAPAIELSELHWLMDMLQSIDVGLIVLDREYRIQVWNSFMENHGGRRPQHVIGKSLFEVLEEIPQPWLRRKVESVRFLKSRAFTTWEQRPYLFRCKNHRPITGASEYMYQNVTFIPLQSVDGQVNHVGLIIYDVTDVAVSRTALEAANAKLEGLSRTDRLTGLYNRGYWEECLVREFARVRRTRRPCSLVMFDIDHFKRVNDSYGHQVGDEVIRHTAARLCHTVRSTDIAGRYGGEEFAVILIDTAVADAEVVAERLRADIEAGTVEYEGGAIRYTVSLGVAELTNDLHDYKQWIERADRALYDSKHGGRNRVTVFRAA